MSLTFEMTYLKQTLACAVPGKTLHFRYRSGWTDAAGLVMLSVCRTQPSGSDCQYHMLLASQSTWLSQNIPITITATEIEVWFYIQFDTTQWLDIDNVYIN